MKPRSERRRDEREGKAPHSRRSRPINIWAAAFIGVGGTIMVVGAILIFSSGGEDGPDSDAGIVMPVTSDEIALEALARRTIESLPNAVWPSLYPEFTDAYHQRCSIEEFTAAGQASAVEQGANLSRIRYVGVQSFDVSETTAELVIVGEVIDQLQYTTGADFEKVNDGWRIAPVAGTSGCEAFDRLSG